MALVAGLIVCITWYITILAGFYILYCPVLYLMFVHHRFYRKLVDTLFALWELFPVALFQCCCSTKLHHYGDYVDSNEKSIIIINHRTRVDWNYIWLALYHVTQNNKVDKPLPCGDHEDNVKYRDGDNKFHKGRPTVGGALNLLAGGISKLKFVLKDEIKAIPGLGWIMQLNFFLYVKRDWREDQLNLTQFVDYYRRLGTSYRIVLFPEGTDLSDANRRKSDSFAVANGLPHFDFVLHPRTTGWAALCSKLRSTGLASVYDATVAYDAPAQTEADLLRGRLPNHVHFHFKRYAIEQIPSEEVELRTWLVDRWREKEVSLRIFHNNGYFFDTSKDKAPVKREARSLLTAKLAFIFWTFIDLLFMYGMFYSRLFQFWVIYHSLLFSFVTWWFGGFHKIQYKLLEMRHI